MAEGQLKLCLALTIFSREYFGRRPIETEFSLIEILLAEGQLKLCLVLTIYSREYFGQRPIETNFSLIEILLAKGQLNFSWPWISIEENISAEGRLKLNFLDHPRPPQAS